MPLNWRAAGVFPSIFLENNKRSSSPLRKAAQLAAYDGIQGLIRSKCERITPVAVAWLFEFHLLDLYGECRYYDSAESVLGAEALKSKAGTSSCGHVTRFDVMFIHLDGPLNAAFTVNPLPTNLYVIV